MKKLNRSTRNEFEAMPIIVNIQMMQKIIYGKNFEYKDFNANTIDELRNIQDKCIIDYNLTFNLK